MPAKGFEIGWKTSRENLHSWLTKQQISLAELIRPITSLVGLAIFFGVKVGENKHPEHTEQQPAGGRE
jgi:hypothetical protein